MSWLLVFPFLNSFHAKNKFSKLIIFSKKLCPLTPPPQQDNVPLIHKIYEIYKLFHEHLSRFPKQERYSLGTKTENTILEILEYILSASFKPKYSKNDLLEKASDKIDLLKILIRLAHETKSLTEHSYILLEQKIIEIGKMIGGWMRKSA